MSVLSDADIHTAIADGRIVIDPFSSKDVQPSSVDIHLDRQFRTFTPGMYGYIDPDVEQPNLTTLIDVSQYFLMPGAFILGQTMERVELSDDIVARIEGRSSLGRLGLLIHSTAGYVDPGWRGNLTLELSSVADVPILLRAGMSIGQITFMEMTSRVDRPYGSSGLGSKYQDQTEPTASRFSRNEPEE